MRILFCVSLWVVAAAIGWGLSLWSPMVGVITAVILTIIFDVIIEITR